MDSGCRAEEVDLLHPLATVQWEQCHKWNRISTYVTHCAVVNDIVVINTHENMSGDVLHVSSVDLKSWAIKTLPYEDVSLTTFRSMFIAVGGHTPSSIVSLKREREITNVILCSATGLDWEMSLPPMPTERFDVSAVGIKSPDALVVAGGVNKNGCAVDTVEVLLEEQWITVHHFPIPYNKMIVAFHDGSLYFARTGGYGITMYSCSVASLISSHEGSNSVESADESLWRKFNAPCCEVTPVSFSSYLVCVDPKLIIRAYCNSSQSWLKVTNTGYKYDRYHSFMAASVLSTGELIVAHGNSGVCKARLSVSSFDPDSFFISDAFCRLESMMGIEIVSVLANVHTQLTMTSGVKLQKPVEFGAPPLPDPLLHPGKYVVEVIRQWSAGNSHRSPTWKNLLEVLQDIDLIDLSQQIEEFLRASSAKRIRENLERNVSVRKRPMPDKDETTECTAGVKQKIEKKSSVARGSTRRKKRGRYSHRKS